jgi:hypothetical protein
MDNVFTLLVIVSYLAITHNFYNLPISFLATWEKVNWGVADMKGFGLYWPLSPRHSFTWLPCFFPSFSAKENHGGVREAR